MVPIKAHYQCPECRYFDRLLYVALRARPSTGLQ